MNDKENQIEEIARTIMYCPFIDADSQSKAIYDKGSRKIPKDSVVLTREKYDDLKEYKNIAEQRKFNLDYANVELRRLVVELNSAEESNAEANRFLDKYRKELEIIKQQLDQARKETAREILDLLVPDCKICDENWHSGCLCLRATLAGKIAKQFGVEIKE